MKGRRKEAQAKPTFVDIFAGCGGLSLGLTNSGWRGSFAIERSPDAFKTLQSNLVVGRRRRFDWPLWLPQSELTSAEFLKKYGDQLAAMKGKVDLLAGGPPCQGFSLAGRRTHSDPRNSLIEDYIKIVGILKPRFLLIENVQGFTLPFKKHGDEESKEIPYSTKVKRRLEEAKYKVFDKLVDLSEYGVPQTRKRFILIAIREDEKALEKLAEAGKNPFDLLEGRRKHFLAKKGLPTGKAVSVRDAIGDLETKDKSLIDSTDSNVKGFMQIDYKDRCFTSAFIKLMRKDLADEKKSPDSLRLPRHGDKTRAQFQKIIATCTQGRTLKEEDRKRLGIKKHATTLLKDDMPSATITTLPDDIIHYSEPRILTARENARIQTFPDWFKFEGKYTTGGKQRKQECPRYTQVGNAVPPLFSEAIGRVLRDLASEDGA